MEIPFYTLSDAGNAITEGEFEIAGFRVFIQTIVEEELYDKGKFDGLFNRVLREGTAGLEPEDLELLNAFISQFHSVCKRCGEQFTWDEMDPLNETIYCSNCRYELARAGDY